MVTETYRLIEDELDRLWRRADRTAYELCDLPEADDGRRAEDWTQALHELRRAQERLTMARRLLGME